MKTKVTLILILLAELLAAQSFNQTIRGRVTDLDTKSPLPGVTVKVLNSNIVI
ncbi:MAG: hypothetical protein ACXITV_05345 [Luteibaculaceae bacterium]